MRCSVLLVLGGASHACGLTKVVRNSEGRSRSLAPDKGSRTSVKYRQKIKGSAKEIKGRTGLREPL